MRMKAQLTIEYLISFGVFVSLVLSLYAFFSANIPAFIENVKKENIRSIAYQVSELLVDDIGEPANWNKNNVERIGLSDERFNKTNLIKNDKIAQLRNLCNERNGYEKLKNKLGINKEISIHIFKINENTGERSLYFNCQPSFVGGSQIRSKVSRIVAYVEDTGEIKMAEVVVQVW